MIIITLVRLVTLVVAGNLLFLSALGVANLLFLHPQPTYILYFTQFNKIIYLFAMISGM